MIDDAIILEKAHRMATKYKHTNSEPYLFNPLHIVDFARAIEKLARQEQREEDARICENIADEYARKNPCSNSEPLMRGCWVHAQEPSEQPQK